MTGSALLVSWIVAVVFTPFLGVKLLPDMARGMAMPPGRPDSTGDCAPRSSGR